MFPVHKHCYVIPEYLIIIYYFIVRFYSLMVSKNQSCFESDSVTNITVRILWWYLCEKKVYCLKIMDLKLVWSELKIIMNFRFQCKSERLFSFVFYCKFFLQAPIYKRVFLEFNSLLSGIELPLKFNSPATAK